MLGNLIKMSAYALLAREVAETVLDTASLREREQARRERNSALAGTLIGLTVGVGLGIMFAPRPGKETRERISDAAIEEFERLQSGIAQGKRQVADIITAKAGSWCSERDEETESES